jgi:hypothetical protein
MKELLSFLNSELKMFFDQSLSQFLMLSDQLKTMLAKYPVC